MKKLYFILIALVMHGIVFSQKTTTPKFTSTNTAYSRGTGVQEITDYTNNSGFSIKILKAYPNPATSYIKFEFQRNYVSGLTLEIYNLPGKKVFSVYNLPNLTTVQLQDFYKGVYLYKLMDRTSKVIESGKFQLTK